MKNIRVFMLRYLFPPEYTGAAIQAITLAKKLREMKVEVTFVTSTLTKDKTIKKQYEGFKVIRFWHPSSNQNISLLFYWVRLFFILLKNYRKYDIIHGIGIFTQNNITAFFGKILRKKTIVKTTLSNEAVYLAEAKDKGKEARLNYYFVNKFDKIIALSSEIKNILTDSGFKKNQVVDIPNGVDSARFHPPENDNEKAKLRKKLDLPEGTIYSYIGVLHTRKKIDWLIENWFSFFKDKENVYLLIAGPNPRDTVMADGGGMQYVDMIKNRVSEIKADAKILFKPFRKEVEDYFMTSDFFINPSESEGLSNSMLEAMACRVIPISSLTSGSEDVITHNRNGYLFGIGNEKEFIGVLADTYNYPEKLNDIACNAHKTIVERFSIEAVCSKYLNVYKSLLN